MNAGIDEIEANDPRHEQGIVGGEPFEAEAVGVGVIARDEAGAIDAVIAEVPGATIDALWPHVHFFFRLLETANPIATA
jgi:hypothetical protein